MLELFKNKKKTRNEIFNTLTAKEFEVFNFLIEGYTMKETSKLLNVKYSTINSHTKSIYKKLGVNSRSQLIIRFHKNIKDKEVKIWKKYF